MAMSCAGPPMAMPTSPGEGGSVVDTIADHDDSMSLGLIFLYDINLVFGKKVCAIHNSNGPGQCGCSLLVIPGKQLDWWMPNFRSSLMEPGTSGRTVSAAARMPAGLLSLARNNKVFPDLPGPSNG